MINPKLFNKHKFLSVVSDFSTSSRLRPFGSVGEGDLTGAFKVMPTASPKFEQSSNFSKAQKLYCVPCMATCYVVQVHFPKLPVWGIVEDDLEGLASRMHMGWQVHNREVMGEGSCRQKHRLKRK